MKFERGSGNVFADLRSSNVEANAAAYADWQAFHAIEIAPHPDLSDTQKRLGLDTDPSARLLQDCKPTRSDQVCSMSKGVD